MTQIEMLRNVAAGNEITDEMMAIAAEMVEKRANSKRKPTEKELAKRAENDKIKERILGVLGAEPKTATVIAGELELGSVQKASSLLTQLFKDGKVAATSVGFKPKPELESFITTHAP
jgi:hypothetical protein